MHLVDWYTTFATLAGVRGSYLPTLVICAAAKSALPPPPPVHFRGRFLISHEYLIWLDPDQLVRSWPMWSRLI